MNKVSPEKLVEAWEKSDNKNDVVKKTGLSIPQIDARIAKYRQELKKLGLPQPKKMPRGTRIDYAAMGELIKRLNA